MMRGHRKFHGWCHNCGYWGHRKVDCKFIIQDQTEKANVTKEENSNDVSLINYDTMLQNYELNLQNLKDIWIADSGASSHMTNDISGLRNQEKINARIKVGSRAYVSSTIKGDLYGTAISKDRKETKIILQNVKYIPGLFCNLISLTTVLQKGFKLSGDQKGIYLKNQK